MCNHFYHVDDAETRPNDGSGASVFEAARYDGHLHERPIPSSIAHFHAPRHLTKNMKSPALPGSTALRTTPHLTPPSPCAISHLQIVC